MFVSFLLPVVDRGAGPLYHWVMLAQMARFPPGDIVFLADEAYFDESAVPFGQNLSVGGVSFVCPDKDTFDRHNKITLSSASLAPIYERFGNHLEVFREVLTHSVPSLVREIQGALSDIDIKCIEAFLTWCNVPSLSEVARELEVSIIHNEIGPLRGGLYVDTAYFDFLGVNGHTATARWESTEELAAEVAGVELLSSEQLRGLLVANRARVESVASVEPAQRYKLGVALQVQDDSNAIAFGHGWTDLKLLYEAISHYPPEDVLVRSHPLARLIYRGGLGIADDSPDSLEFLNRVDRVLSVNSSLLAEAALWEVPFQAKGDCPFSCLAEDAPGGRALGEDRCVWLNAFFLGYLIPAKLLFDPEYYRWRLAESRSLGQRIQRHISAYRETQLAFPALKLHGGAPAATEITRFSASWTQEFSLEKRLKIATDTIEHLAKEIKARDEQISRARNWQTEAERVWEAHEWFRMRTEALDREHTEWRTTLDDLSRAVAGPSAPVDDGGIKSTVASRVKHLYELRHAYELGLTFQQQLEGELAKEKETVANLQDELRLNEERHHCASEALRRERDELIARMEMESQLLLRQLEATTARLERLYASRLSLKERITGRIRNTP
ncbi:hypothetical protein CH75_24130 [Dyella jiangningensis]|nr:hypothetical protein CH75_01050 [Dyella jiangningensis]AHX16505.1 hypothetical protein CH75_24130 [Dyella jiangningensis]